MRATVCIRGQGICWASCVSIPTRASRRSLCGTGAHHERGYATREYKEFLQNMCLITLLHKLNTDLLIVRLNSRPLQYVCCIRTVYNHIRCRETTLHPGHHMARRCGISPTEDHGEKSYIDASPGNGIDTSREELVDRGVALLVLLENLLRRDNEFAEKHLGRIRETHLCHCELEVFLCDMLPALTERIHTRLGTDTAHLSSRTLSHLLRQSAQVDTALK